MFLFVCDFVFQLPTSVWGRLANHMYNRNDARRRLLLVKLWTKPGPNGVRARIFKTFGLPHRPLASISERRGQSSLTENRMLDNVTDMESNDDAYPVHLPAAESSSSSGCGFIRDAVVHDEIIPVDQQQHEEEMVYSQYGKYKNITYEYSGIILLRTFRSNQLVSIVIGLCFLSMILILGIVIVEGPYIIRLLCHTMSHVQF